MEHEEPNTESAYEKSTMILHNDSKNFIVEVFKTNVQHETEANDIIRDLYQLLPGSRINFDLMDCDKILRVAAEFIDPVSITDRINAKGYICEVLE